MVGCSILKKIVAKGSHLIQGAVVWQVVQSALDSLMTGSTVVVVAHRLSTIRGADKIVVFNRGVVVEQGSHDALMATPGSAYSDLVVGRTAHD